MREPFEELFFSGDLLLLLNSSTLRPSKNYLLFLVFVPANIILVLASFMFWFIVVLYIYFMLKLLIR